MTAQINNTPGRGERKLSDAALEGIATVVAEARTEERWWGSKHQSSRALALAGNTWDVYDWDEV